ncbi:MAG: LPS-assembly protein LptD, partial [Alphaproteobacteria bacterium]
MGIEVLQGGRKPYTAVSLKARLALMHGFRASVIALALLGMATPAVAKEDLLTKPSLNENSTNQPLLLQADELITDQKENRIVARGHVEVYYKNYALQADQLIYDRRAKTLNAVGNVRIKEPNGSLINAERISLTEDFRNGFIRSFKAVTRNDTRIAAANAYRKDGNTTVFEKGRYTPCKPCAKDPDRAPLWSIRAGKITHKKDEKNIYFEDAAFEVFGLPVIWMPYFYYPDPTVKRRSGFLAPKMTLSDDLGYTFALPYYYSLSPSADLTVTPKVTTKAGYLLETDWRQRLATGSYNIKLAGVFDDDPEEDTRANNNFRGSIQSAGEFELGSFWKWGWDVTAESDDTFRRFYKLDDVYATDRVSTVYMIGQCERNYLSINAYHFGGINAEVDNPAHSLVHPSIDYNYIFADPILGGELSYDANALSMSRDNGGDVSRVINEVKWRRTLTDTFGQQFTPFASARGDVYKTTSFTDLDGDQHDSTTVMRGSAMAGVEYRYPFVKHTANATHVIEPIAQIIARPELKDQGEVPNEDALSLVFDDTLLFDTDKFSGYDRIETGTRVNYGMQYRIDMNSGLNARVALGQSRQIAGANPFSDDSGLETRQSDYVAGVYIDILRNLQLVSQLRFDEDNGSLKRQDLSVSGHYGPVQGAVNYVSASEQLSLGLPEREEVAGSLALKLAENWTLFGDARYDIDREDII